MCDYEIDTKNFIFSFKIFEFKGVTYCFSLNKEPNRSGNIFSIKIPRMLFQPSQDPGIKWTVDLRKVTVCRLSTYLPYIPTDLYFTNLVELSLECFLTEVPHVVLNLNPNLRKLVLRNNLLKSFQIPGNIEAKLQYLDISGNPFFINAFNTFSNLQSCPVLNSSPHEFYLYVYHNISNKNLFTFLRSVPNLQQLLRNDDVTQLEIMFTNEFFKPFKRMISLEELHLSNLRLFHTFNENLCDFKNLTRLNISNNKIQDFPECFSNLKSLRNLDASNNLFKFIPSNIGNLTELEELNFSNNIINTTLPDNLENLSKLKKLLLKMNLLEIPNYSPLHKLKNLEVIDVIGNQHFNELFYYDNDSIEDLTSLSYTEENSTSENDTEPEIIDSEYVPEENWDFDVIDIYDDSFLQLPPYSFSPPVEIPKIYESDFIDPRNFEEATDECF